MRLLFLIRSLHPAGAERQLTELVKGLAARGHETTVVTYYEGGALEDELKGREGVSLLSLGKSGRWDVLAFVRFWLLLCRTRPDIAHGYMGISNELCLLGKLVGARAVWGIRSSSLPTLRRTWIQRLVGALGSRLSHLADLIICNSEAGKAYANAQGYSTQCLIVIPNGIDVDRFCPDRPAGALLRRKWGVPDGVPLIGNVGRLDAQKDYPTFLRAAARLTECHPTARYVCIGDGPERYAALLRGLAAELGIGDRVIWAGHVRDMTAAYNALDLLVSSSPGEGFSNVIGEGMACGVPCVVTDVGDSAQIVGNPACVAPSMDPEALAAACAHFLDRPPAERAVAGVEARHRIVREFSVPRLVERTEAVLAALL